MEKFGLIGKSISHSLSPAIHAVFGNDNYKLYPLEINELEDFFSQRDFRGLNVTMPYKKTVIDYLDEAVGVAKELRAVNTIIKTKDNRLMGYNTDYDGFIYSIDKNGVNLKDKNILILGTGGAAKTVRAVCQKRKAKSINNVSRTGKLNYDNVYNLTDTDIIINATPVGMYPNNGHNPIDLSCFPKCMFVFDLVYNPLKTALLIQAEELNIPNTNGLEMLAAQARKGAELFTDKKIDEFMINKAVEAVKKQTTNIVLIGMPGSGKTTIGKILADKLDRQFLDTDTYIQQHYNKTPSEIIIQEGESAFRDYESNAAVQAGKSMNTVIATGGGMVLKPENMGQLSQNSLAVIYIDRNLELLEISDRPLSKDKNSLKALYELRLPLYQRHADFTVDGNFPPNVVADNIIKSLSL